MKTSARAVRAFRQSAVLVVFGALIGCSNPTAPEHAAELFERAPSEVEGLAAMILRDVGEGRLLVIRPDHLATDSASIWAPIVAETHAAQTSLTRSRLDAYLHRLQMLDAQGISTMVIQDTRVVEITLATSGLSISGCILSLVNGREPWPNEPGNPVEVIRLRDGWFAEEACT